MREIWYEINIWRNTPEPLTVVGETEKMITIEYDTALYGGKKKTATRRRMKGDCYRTRGEAIAEIRRLLTGALQRAEDDLDRARRELDEFNAREESK